ncbi:3-deoxy-D-manno-octulosonic acid kinase [Chromohalobacter marismortui]|uniref:3-deoxy-D-manno-octulosonic acid kinase n=1 Tax=Chromohalobacter marismortui TaxID=42055 RepID=A0A4R7NNC2_9GAMM|nr:MULTISPECIES: 3-deoxy-D-manno-octulosonic acid kinase [Chromohalobacter]MCI0509933.1 3-deoxy-D-manno-octulosonic acid kinase [Chromohalobacter sp.]MCI0592657.1 3-deoxy-D-manno-octulosonic acid kinase [Chromohalobacter sp.]TDU22168.1 3-deoxy-D-manno-octulosonic acid kinase [Chromohalobacter marismortui]
MRLATFQTGQAFILYDADILCDAGQGPQIGADWFTPTFWRSRDAVLGEAPGRGASLFVTHGDERWALRPYRRGGLIARLSDARYAWTGLERTRAFREMRLTAELKRRGLPVPTPVAAAVWHHTLSYEAALITRLIPDVTALAERLPTATPALLRRVGHTVRRFHDAGLDHVDLNARNLLVDADDGIWLIDFDRCRLRTPGRWQEANLERLGRSLAKFGAPQALQTVRQGYAVSP